MLLNQIGGVIPKEDVHYRGLLGKARLGLDCEGDDCDDTPVKNPSPSSRTFLFYSIL